MFQFAFVPVSAPPAALLPFRSIPAGTPANLTNGIPSRTRESRHHSRASASTLSVDTLPVYERAESNLPPYTTRAVTEPVTLAMYFFKFGFLFPPLWIIGAFFIFAPFFSRPSPQSPSSSWLPEKTDAERQETIDRLHGVQVKWGLKCLWAFGILACVVVSVTLAVWVGVSMMKFQKDLGS